MPKRSFCQIGLFVLLIALLLLPNIYTTCVAVELIHLPIKQITYIGTCLVLLLIPAFFLKARTYFIMEGVFNFLLFPIEVCSLYLNHQVCSEAFLINIYHTNFSEAKELLTSLYPIVIGVIVMYILFFVLCSKVENQYFFPRLQKRYVFIGFIGLWIAGIGVLLFVLRNQHREMNMKEKIVYANDLLVMKAYKIFPYNIYLHSYHILKKQIEIKHLQKQVADFQFDVPQKTTDSSELYILIIGEAARYDHQGFNGYERNTTPHLSSLSHFISYDSIYSEANLTAHSLPLILTRADACHREIAYQEKTLPEAFAQSGFDTYWLIKQPPYSFVERAMKNATYCYAENISSTDKEDNYDIDIISALQSIGEPQRPSMMVIHLLGCHFRYDQRYPEEYKVFQPTWDKDHFSYMLINPANKEWFVNAYDNSLLYTDYVVSQIIEWAKQCHQPSVVMYVSDHGESLWDDGNMNVLHGSYNVLPHEFHVPLCVWYSEEYKQKYPDKVAAMYSNKSVKQNTGVVFYSLLDLANIPIPNTQQKSICGSLAPTDTLYVINGKGELDILQP